jgi:hypothetical protein
MKVPILLNEDDFYGLLLLLRCRSETAQLEPCRRVAWQRNQILSWSGDS